MPSVNRKAAALTCRTVLTQVKQQYVCLLGSALLAPALPPKHMPEGAVFERLHMAILPEERDSCPGPRLAARSQQGGPCLVLLLLLTVYHGLSKKELKKGTKSCGFHIPSTRLDKVKPKHLISHVLSLPQTCCWMRGPALQ